MIQIYNMYILYNKNNNNNNNSLQPDKLSVCMLSIRRIYALLILRDVWLISIEWNEKNTVNKHYVNI